jgi:hypothetical protein
MPARSPVPGRVLGRAPACVLAVTTVALLVWRGACVFAGPDIDTDAYAHHMIARAILADPGDLAVHWVWLPLFHYLQVPFVAAGGTLNGVRWANMVLAALLPIVLFLYVRVTSTRRGPARPALPPEWTALLAALVLATCPIVVQMGTTAQPEPLFALVMLGVAIAYDAGRTGIAAALLSAGVLLRYEAWASLAAIAAIQGVERLTATRVVRSWMRLERAPAARSPNGWLLVAAPVSLILAWAALRRPVDGQWFGFVRQTHEFASQVAESAASPRGALSHGVLRLVDDALYYPVFVALRVMGPALPLAVLGVARAVREQGWRFVVVLGACLVFVSLSWIRRSSLGLDRHFVVAVPLYAVFAAQGAAVVADAVARLSRARFGELAAGRAGRAIGGAVAVACVAGMCVSLQVWMGFWRASIARGWPDRQAVGAALRELPAASTIFCDDATLEILSGVDRRRFDRHWLDDPATWDRVEQVAHGKGGAYVATWRRKIANHESDSEVVLQAGTSPDDPLAGVEVLRVGPDGGRAAR